MKSRMDNVRGRTGNVRKMFGLGGERGRGSTLRPPMRGIGNKPVVHARRLVVER
jgi:hypothetical protein